MTNRLPVALQRTGLCAFLLMLVTACAQHGVLPGGVSAPGVAPQAAASWMLPEAKTADLLYVSDQVTNDVYVYSWPDAKREGTLTGFNAPGNLCTDTNGDVYVTNYRSHDILEYAHGGRSPIKTLKARGEDPYGCSVDPASGDLAVTNISSAKSSLGGDLLVYKEARGTPKAFTAPRFVTYISCGYDDRGNLFIDGYDTSDAFAFAELPQGHNALLKIAINRVIMGAGDVLWHGKYITVGDSVTGSIFDVQVSRSKGIVKGSTRLHGSSNVYQYWIGNGSVVATNITNFEKAHGFVAFWKYPAGGEFTDSIRGFKKPNGVTVSLAK